jgi:hypothetical protein
MVLLISALESPSKLASDFIEVSNAHLTQGNDGSGGSTPAGRGVWATFIVIASNV